MRITFLLIFTLCCFIRASFAQSVTYSIKGSTADTASFTQLTATVTVLNVKDSILVAYDHSVNNGIFTINNLQAGSYLLLVTYPDYADYIEAFTLDAAHPTRNFGEIKMQLKANLLKEVLIKGEVNAMKIKGDTTEFNAKAYVIQPNSKLEDLLKQFPGIEIDRQGKITANGEKVKKVLLDGEEYFGDDPTLITRNIRGDMVDRVQLYDKKSDQATLAGIDDPNKVKTLNIILKEDKKKGVFGKVDAGAANHGYYEGQGIYNKFTVKNKLTFYGTVANDGITALGSADASKANGSSSSYDDLDNSGYSGRGLPMAINTGMHYDNRWDTNKQSINSNFRVGSLGVTTNQNTITQNTLPTGTSNAVSNSDTYSYFSRQKVDGVYQYTPDVNTSIRFTGEAGINNNENRSTGASTSTDGAGSLKNTQNTSQHSTGQDKLFSGQLYFTKKFKKIGRNFTLNSTGTFSDSYINNYNYSNLYTVSNTLNTIIDQYKPTTSNRVYIYNSATYSEPLSKSLTLTFNYSFSLTNSLSDQESYNQSTPGNYNKIDTAFSNNYKFDQMISRPGATFNYHLGTKTTFTAGTNISSLNYKQTNESNARALQRSFTSIEPNATFRYSPATSKSFSLTYRGSNQQPSITQIQPLKDNTNQTNIIIGNPDLKSSFYQSYSASYRQTQSVTNSSLGISGNYSYTTNQIGSNRVTDTATLKSTTQYINLGNKTPFSYYLDIEDNFRSVWFGGIHIYIDLYTTYNVNYNYINSALERGANQTYLASVRVTRAKKNKYTLETSIAPAYHISKYLLQPSSNNNTFGFGTENDATIYITKKFQFNTTFDFNYAAKTPALPATTFAIWNASFSRTFLKDDNLKISLSGNNILDQYKNTRFQNSTTITQSTYNAVKRYFMLTLTWDFTKFGTSAAPAKSAAPVKK